MNLPNIFLGKADGQPRVDDVLDRVLLEPARGPVTSRIIDWADLRRTTSRRRFHDSRRVHFMGSRSLHAVLAIGFPLETQFHCCGELAGQDAMHDLIA